MAHSMTRLRINDPVWVYADVISRGDDFTISTGSLRGERSNGAGWFAAGRLAGDDLALFNRSRDAGITYVVYSYATPIAWCERDGSWYLASDSFSVTTSKHQNKIRAAISMIVEPGPNFVLTSADGYRYV